MTLKWTPAPWTPEQVAWLTEMQNNPSTHPMTCGACRDRLHVEGVLIVTPDGLTCETCDNIQTSALLPADDDKPRMMQGIWPASHEGRTVALGDLPDSTDPVCTSCDGSHEWVDDDGTTMPCPDCRPECPCADCDLPAGHDESPDLDDIVISRTPGKLVGRLTFTPVCDEPLLSDYQQFENPADSDQVGDLPGDTAEAPTGDVAAERDALLLGIENELDEARKRLILGYLDAPVSGTPGEGTAPAEPVCATCKGYGDSGLALEWCPDCRRTESQS